MLSNLVHQVAQFSSAIRPRSDWFASGWWVVCALLLSSIFWVGLVHLILGWLQ